MKETIKFTADPEKENLRFNSSLEAKNSIIDINDIWHTAFEPENAQSMITRNSNEMTNNSEDLKQKAVYVTWSDITVSLRKKDGLFDKLIFKDKSTKKASPKILIQNGWILFNINLIVIFKNESFFKLKE